jgi:hypothetical protein
MADSEPTNATPASQILKPAELSALAARLRARAESVLMRDQPEQQRDMLTAVSLVMRLIHLQAEIRRAADATEDEATERHLREMLGGTEDIPASGTPLIISESDTHVVLAVEIAKAMLVAHRRLFVELIAAADERRMRR